MKKTLRVIPLVWGVMIAYGIWSYLNPAITERSTDTTTIQTYTWEEYSVIQVTDGLQVPRSMAFTSPDRILVTERWWAIRVIEDGILNPSPLLTISSISNQSEEWLMGITLDPSYNTNKYVYIAYAYTAAWQMLVKIVRLTDLWDTLSDETIIIDNLPAAQRHAWTALAFWPDEKLYITVGDATQSERAQFPDYYNGKILRINPDGTIPEDNPSNLYATRALWLRNSQWIARDSKWEMYAVDHGPSIFDGPPGWDEINHIQKNGNYGRPLLHHEMTQTGMIDPIAIYTPAIAPASLMIYDGDMFPTWKNNLFIGMLKGEWVLKVTLDPNDPNRIINQERIIDNSYWRIRAVVQWPDGSIYFSTSNQDSRWESSPQWDSIYQIKVQ